MAAEMCDFYDWLNNSWEATLLRFLCIYVHVCVFGGGEDMISVGNGNMLTFMFIIIAFRISLYLEYISSELEKWCKWTRFSSYPHSFCLNHVLCIISLSNMVFSLTVYVFLRIRIRYLFLPIKVICRVLKIQLKKKNFILWTYQIYTVLAISDF